MKKHLLTLATVLFAAGALFTSCANDPEEPQIQILFQRVCLGGG